MLTSLFGRRLGFDQNQQLLGVPGLRFPITNQQSEGTTIMSTGAAPVLVNYGFSLVGSTLTSGSTGSSGTGGFFTLQDPAPGVLKTLYCPSSAPAVVSCTAAHIASTGGDTFTQVTLASRAWVQLLGISTALWVAQAQFQITTGNGTAVPVAFV